MAKLHRRVPRLPHHHLSESVEPDQAPPPAPEEAAALDAYRRASRAPRSEPVVLRSAVQRAVVLSALMLALAPSASAQQGTPEVAEPGDPRLVRLEQLASQLASESEAERRAAYEALTTLEPDMLPAIRARLARIVRRRPEPAWAFEIFNRIRRAAGSQRADDDVDIAPGALVVLREDRSRRVLQMVEPLLLWRSLERMASFEAGQAMYPLFGLDEGVWRHEERRIVDRMGNDIMAAAIAGRNHSDRRVRQWASETMRRLGADDPGRAVQRLDPDQLADVLRAYAMLRMQSAMRVIVSYVGSERRGIRRAARWAIEQYGGNAIWVLRTEYHAKTGEHAPEHWGWRRVAEALYAHVDAQRMEPVRRAREAGLAALARGDLEAMREHFDDVLARAPDLEDPGPVAAGYAALGDARLEAHRLRDAIAAYRRALRLAPEHESARVWW
ncbi:MAG TPA: hypothetical protein VIL20_14120, partial [Sandaracinaceae bacterium]